jgi:hypothetical protein
VNHHVAFLCACVACTPEPELVVAPTSPSTTQTVAAAPAKSNLVDVGIAFEEGPDERFGQGATAVRAVLDIPALAVHRTLFTVPAPYHCGRGLSPTHAAPGNDLAVYCMGDDAIGSALIHLDEGRITLDMLDYAKLDRDKNRDEIHVPSGAVVNMYAPVTYPGK